MSVKRANSDSRGKREASPAKNRSPERPSRIRGLHVVKSRGMAHSRELYELVVSDKGVELGNVMTGTGLAATVAG